MIFSLLSHRFLLVVSAALFPLLLTAQTPLANRVKAMARHLPAGAEVVSKYTDNHRHCLYYTLYNRLFRYDVVTNKSVGVEFHHRLMHVCCVLSSVLTAIAFSL